MNGRRAAGARTPAHALAALALCGSLPLGGALAQKQPPRPRPAAEVRPAEAPDGPRQAAAAQPRRDFTLTVSKTAPYTVSLAAKNARLTEVAAQLTRRLNVPVRVSPQLAERRVTVEFEGLGLEGALRMIAPHPYVDYVGGGDDQGQARPLAVYLYAADEPAPSIHETVKSNTEALLIEGNTEEGTEEYEKNKPEEPVQVTFTNNRLGVRARKQPLGAVAYKVASVMGVPFDLAADSPEVVSALVDAEFSGYTFEQAMRAISPAVRFYYRADLLNYETQPIRVVLGGRDPLAAPAGADARQGGKP